MLDKSKLIEDRHKNTTLNEEEIAKFDAMAQQWWDPEGKFKTALEFNQARLNWLIPQIAAHYGRSNMADADLSQLLILDVGSGGGLISESLAQKGAQVLGIDASPVSVAVARQHAAQSQVQVEYRHCLSRELVQQGNQYDVVINAEVVEHVPDQAQLIEECCQLVKPGGLLILATLNRTLTSFVVAIVGAEYVMRYLPIGTHDWRYFVKPDELRVMAEKHGCQLVADTGMKYSLIKRQWRCTQSQSVNYIQAYRKK